MQQIAIRTEKIQLDQLLKLAGVIDTGGQVRYLLDEQKVLLNGEQVKEKRRQIRVGDIVTIIGAGEIEVVQE